ncbi:ankyrin repeat domain-containing protein [Parachlamydia sp. AcF125]|uniref:ankyrin repeat domain-containing protein n=1 Tax=Parachlamydia sp. AcF125 TaxID=2795736 RepID=UPI001BC9FD7A|nr:ankyrin repeat domain-containing protein [Parachlamydia sp. AcF125]MBS4169261.1 hypothetical protein [Parachlamydia sp. AcF125]
MNPFASRIDHSFKWVVSAPEDTIIKKLNTSPQILKKIIKNLPFPLNKQIFNKIIGCVKKSVYSQIDYKTLRIFLRLIDQQEDMKKEDYYEALKEIVSFDNILRYSSLETIKQLRVKDFFNNVSLEASLTNLCANPQANADLLDQFIGSDVSLHQLNQSLLIQAAQHNPTLIEILLERGIPPCEIALYKACGNPHTAPAVLSMLIEKLAAQLGSKEFINSAREEGNTPLIYACKKAPHLIPVLLKHGADLNRCNTRFQYPLYFLCASESISIEYLQSLLAPETDKVKICKAVFFLCTNPKATPDLLQLLIARGGEVNLEDDQQLTPLDAACEANPSLIPFLLEKGAIPNIQDFIWACGNPHTPPEALAILIEKLATQLGSKKFINCTVEEGTTPLMYACRRASHLIPVLLEHGANPDMRNNHFHFPLHFLCLSESISIEHLQLLLAHETDQAKIHKALFLLCANPKANPELLECLNVQRGKLDVVDTQGHTLLTFVCKKNPHLIPFILEKGATPSIEDIELACSNPHTPPKALAVLIKSLATQLGGTDFINSPDNQGNTPLMHACMHAPALIQTLLVHGANPNIKNQKGLAAIHFLCMSSLADFSHFRWLIEARADMEALDANENSILHYLCKDPTTTAEFVAFIFSALSPHETAKNLFLNHTNQEGKTALKTALETQASAGVIEFLLDNKATIHPEDPLLPYACLHPHMTVSCLAKLIEAERLEREASEYLNVPFNGLTPLEWACQAAPLNRSVIDFLCKNGAQVTNGSLLHHLCSNPNLNPRLLNYFIEKYALQEEINSLNHEGLSPLEIVYLNNPLNRAIIPLLINHVAKYMEGHPDSGIPQSLLFKACANPDLAPEDLAHLISWIKQSDPDVVNLPNELGETALSISIQASSSLENIELLLQHGANVFISNLEGSSPLHLACANSRLNPQILELLLQAARTQCPEKDLINSQDAAGRTALHIALLKEEIKLEFIAILLKFDANVQITDFRGESPLHFVCKNPGMTVFCLEKLISANFEHTTLGAYLNLKNIQGQTPLHLLCLNSEASLAQLNILLGRGAIVENEDIHKNTPLHYACKNLAKTSEMIAALLSHSHDKKKLALSQNNAQQTPLHILCATHFASAEILRLLINQIEDIASYIEAPDHAGLTAIQIACRSSLINEPLVELLIDLGANLNLSYPDGDSLLHALCYKQPSLQLLSKILEKAPSIASRANQEGLIPLHLVCKERPFNPEIFKLLSKEKSHLEIVNPRNQTPIELLFKNRSVTPLDIVKVFAKETLPLFASRRFNHGATLLHWACLKNTSLIPILLDNGADVQALSDNKSSVLHCLCQNLEASPSSLGQLIKAFLNQVSGKLSLEKFINVENQSNATPLLIACLYNFGLVEELLRHGANPAYVNLSQVCLNKELPPQILRLFLEALKESPDFERLMGAKDPEGLTALHRACRSNRALILELLNYGAKVEILDAKNCNALHYVFLKRKISLKLLSRLLEKNAVAIVNQKNLEGLTPFHLACENASFNHIKELLPYAELREKDGQERSPFFLLFLNKRLSLEEIYELVKKDIPLDSLDHPEFPIATFLGMMIRSKDWRILISAIQNRMSIRKIHETLNTSNYFYDHAYFSFIRPYLLTLLNLDPGISLSEKEFKQTIHFYLSDFLKSSSLPESLLEIPLLLQDRQLMIAVEREIEKQWGESALETWRHALNAKNYARHDLQNMNYEVDPTHFTTTSSEDKEIPPAPEFDLHELEERFLEINFTDPSLPGFRDPAKLTCDGYPTSIQVLHSGFQLDGNGGIQGLIKRIIEKPKDFAGVPKEEAEYKKHYDDFENILKHLGHLLRSMEDADSKTSILLDIAAMGLFCGGRIVEAKRMYALYCTPLKGLEQTLKVAICDHLQGHRQGILENWAKKIPDAVFETHRFNQLMYLVGGLLNLPFAETYARDPYSNIQLDQEEVYAKFQYEYTPMEIFKNVKDFLEEGLKNPRLRDEICEWFADNAPSHFLEEPYLKILSKIEELQASKKSWEQIDETLLKEKTRLLANNDTIKIVLDWFKVGTPSNSLKIRFLKAFQKVEELKLSKSRKEIRQILQQEDEIFLAGDQTIEEAIAIHQKQDYLAHYKPLPLEEWQSSFYQPLLNEIQERQKTGHSLESIYSYLKEKGIDLANLYDNDIPLEVTPEKAVLEHRRQTYFLAQPNESNWKAAFYKEMLDHTKKLPRSKARQYLLEKEIVLKKDRKLKTLLKQAFASEYLHTMIQFEEKTEVDLVHDKMVEKKILTYSIQDEAIFDLLKRMQILK